MPKFMLILGGTDVARYYMSTSYVGSNAFPVYASATAPIGGVFQEHTFTSQQAASSFTGPTMRSHSTGVKYTRHAYRLPAGYRSN